MGAQVAERVEARGLGVQEASRYVGLGATKLRELIRTKQIRTVRIGSKIIVPVSELEKLLAGE